MFRLLRAKMETTAGQTSSCMETRKASYKIIFRKN